MDGPSFNLHILDAYDYAVNIFLWEKRHGGLLLD